MTENVKISRRNFVKGAGLGVVTTALAWGLEGCIGKGEVRNIEEGESIVIRIGGEEKVVEVYYSPEIIDKEAAGCVLGQRRSGNIRFSPKNDIYREIGEITNNTVSHIKASEDYPKVTLYSTPGIATSLKDKIGVLRNDNEDLYGLEIIAKAQDWTGTGSLPPTEGRPTDHPDTEKGANVTNNYASGRAVFRFNKEGTKITVLGYVCDPRVIEETEI